MTHLFLPASAAALLIAAPAAAASFDCAAASGPVARAVCADPALSAADERMASLYAERRAELSADGQRRLRQSQRSWERFVRTVCPQSGPIAAARRERPQDCLGRAYEARVADLQSTLQRIGPFRFLFLRGYGAAPDAREYIFGSYPGFTVRTVSEPRIDGDGSPAAARWNAFIAKTARIEPSRPETDAPPRADRIEEIKIVFASRDLISARLIRVADVHGSTRPARSEAMLHYLFARARPMTPYDLFRPGSGWERVLAERSRAELEGTLGLEFRRGAIAIVEHTVRTPRSWTLEASGLTIRFPPEVLFDYALEGPRVTIPWSELRRYLAAERAVPFPPP